MGDRGCCWRLSVKRNNNHGKKKTATSWCTVNRLRYIKAVSGKCRPPTATPIRTAYMEWRVGWTGGHQYLRKLIGKVVDVLPVEVSDCGRGCMHARQDIYHRQTYISNVNGGCELKYSNIFYVRQCLVSSTQSVSGECS